MTTREHLRTVLTQLLDVLTKQAEAEAETAHVRARLTARVRAQLRALDTPLPCTAYPGCRAECVWPDCATS